MNKIYSVLILIAIICALFVFSAVVVWVLIDIFTTNLPPEVRAADVLMLLIAAGGLASLAVVLYAKAHR